MLCVRRCPSRVKLVARIGKHSHVFKAADAKWSVRVGSILKHADLVTSVFKHLWDDSRLYTLNCGAKSPLKVPSRLVVA